MINESETATAFGANRKWLTLAATYYMDSAVRKSWLIILEVDPKIDPRCS